VTEHLARSKKCPYLKNCKNKLDFQKAKLQKTCPNTALQFLTMQFTTGENYQLIPIKREFSKNLYEDIFD